MTERPWPPFSFLINLGLAAASMCYACLLGPHGPFWARVVPVLLTPISYLAGLLYLWRKDEVTREDIADVVFLSNCYWVLALLQAKFFTNYYQL